MRFGILALISCLSLAACDDQPPTNVAPSATTLTDTKPKAAGAMDFAIDTSGSAVTFMMEAPKEKIRGKVQDATRGEIQIDLSDVTKTTGHLYVDLKSLELFQQVAAEDGSFGAEEKQPLQNEHARAWLEIGPCDDADDKAACEEAKKKNENVEFVITEVKTDQKDVMALSGDSRTIKATVTGDFLLHQHKTQKSAEVEITFHMKGDKPDSVSIKTTKPFAIGLAEHDVRPRTAFGKIAAKTLDALIDEDKKIAKEAEVSLELKAAFKGMAKGDKPAEGATQPASSAAP